MSGVAFTRCFHLSLFQNRADKGGFCLAVAVSVCAEAAGQSLLEQMVLLGGLTHSRQRLCVCTVLRGVACGVAGM